MSWFWRSKEGEEEDCIQEVTDAVLDTYLGESWRRRGFKHLTFRSEVFNLKSLDGLLRQPIDLTALESLDVTENSLRDLDCIAGTSKNLKKLGMPQGLIIFGSLQVLKLKKNQLSSFSLKLPAIRELDLSYNLLEAIPNLEGLPKLEVLLLDHNRINGPLLEVGSARVLKKLDLSNNQFLYSAVELDRQIENLTPFVSLALKLKDNPFCATIPSYQILCLQKLPELRKLDDINPADMDAQREAALKTQINVRALDDLAANYEGVKVSEDVAEHGKAMLAVFRPANKMTVFQEIAEYFTKALSDPSSTTVCIAGLTRLTHTISQCQPVDMENLRKELSKGKPAAERIAGLMRDIKALALWVEEPTEKLLIFRAVAKLSVINEHHMGDECMKLLRSLTELHPQAEEKVIGMLQELIIMPLKHEYAAHPDPKRTRTYSYLRILAHFDSPKMGSALKAITQELTDIFCKLAKEVFSGREDLSYSAVSILMEKWSSNLENFKEEPKIGYNEIMQTMLHILELEMATLCSLEMTKETRGETEAVAMLCTACNMLASKQHAVVKVFLSWWPGRPSFWMRIMQKIMQIFGHTKKSDARPSMKALTPATARVLAKLFDVMGALMALPDNGDLVEEILEGHDYHGQLLRYMVAVVEDEERSQPLSLAGGLRLALTVLSAYVSREDKGGVTAQVIAGLREMRPMMYLLSMQGPSFSKLWQTCAGSAQEPRPRQLTHPVVIEIFEAMIRLVTFFSDQEGHQYAEVRRVVGHDREELMFQLITVPNAQLKNAALECLGSARVADTSCSEMESLIGLLDVKGEELQASFTYLERIMSQLNKMLVAQTGNGAMALRTTHAKMVLDMVLKIFVRTAQCNPDSEFSAVRVRMLQACLEFLNTSGRNLREWRQHHLRAKNASSAVKLALQSEDRFDLDVPDISVERTWTGRSVETLLQCFSGLDRLRPGRKVAFRLLCRIADVMDGHSDFMEAEEQDQDEELHERLMKEELKPWNEEKMRKNLGYLDNMEEDDRRVQQEIFTSANGAQRLEMFLQGLYPLDSKSQARVVEVALIQKGIQLIEESKLSAAEVEVDDFEGGSSSSSSSNGEANSAEAAIIDMPARDFSGVSGDLMAFDDLRPTFANKFQTAFSILFTARWDSFNYWSSIIDFGNGPAQENIVIANQGRLNTLIFEVHRQGICFAVAAPAVLKLHQTCTYLCTISEDGIMCIQSNGEIIGQSTGIPACSPHARKYLYVGKSCWPERDLFHGHIAELKIWNGQAVDWHEVVDTVFEEGQSGFDRPLLMKELLHSRPVAKMPEVHGADPFSHAEVTKGQSAERGHIDDGYFVSALLRCCYAVVQVPASPKAESEMVNTLLDKHLVVRLLSLVRMCGPFDCCCGIKFLQLMSTVLLSRSSNPDVEMLVTCYLVMSYVASIVDDAVRALQGDAQQQMLGRLLSEQMAKLCSVVCGSLQYLHFADEDKQFHAKFVECVLDEMVPQRLLQAFVHMALYSDKSQPQIAMVEDVRQLLVKIIERCPPRQRETWQVLCSILLTGEVDRGQEWLSDLLEAVQKSAAQRALEEQEAAKAFGTQKITYEDSHPERALGSFNVEVVAFNNRLSVSRETEGAFLNLVITNKAIRIVDSSVVGYPAEDPGQIPDCEWKLKDLVRITRGFLPQGLFVSVRRPSADAEGRDTEGIVAVVFHRSKDRDAALGKLQHLKILPVDEDRHLAEVLEEMQLGDIVQAAHSPPEEPMLSRLLMPLDSKLRLFVLTRSSLHDLMVDYSQWRPRSSEELEDRSGQFKISPEIKSIRDATLRDSPEGELPDFVSRVGEARSLASLEKVSFFQEAQPRMEMSFQGAEDLRIGFFEDTAKDRWREDILEVLQSMDPSGAGWSRHVRGEATPLHG